VPTTAKEFDLLAFLAASPRQVFTREELLRQVWSSSSEWQDPATVTEHVRRLRLKIEAEPDRPRWIVTVRGVGYRFDP
jgi:two-component system phosphate regulon response regulator PhoB